MRNLRMKGQYALYKDRIGQWRWRAIASNGKVIADSGEGYGNKADALHGIWLIQNSGDWLVYERAA
jgi:uncharacterized protein